MQPLSFFFEHIGDTIFRGNTPVLVTPENYTKLYELQDKEYTFRAPVRIHQSVDTCVSCEG